MNYLDCDMDIDYLQVDYEEFAEFIFGNSYAIVHYADSTIYKDRDGVVVAIYRLKDNRHFILA